MQGRLKIVTGKGGVGRSAVTSAIAIAAARSGRRVLAAAMTDPTGLASHFGLAEIGYEPAVVEPNLSVMAIERAKALDEYLRMQLGIGRRMPLLPLSRSLEALSETVPGIRDVVTTGKLYHEVRSGDWDLVVADGPPTGQIMSYLRASRVIASLVPSGQARQQADAMTDLLAAPESSLVMVTLAQELPVTETLEALAELGAEQLIGPGGVFVNRSVQPLGVSRAALAKTTDGLARDAGVFHRSLYENQKRWREALPDYTTLPLLFGEHDPTRVADQLAEHVADAVAT